MPYCKRKQQKPKKLLQGKAIERLLNFSNEDRKQKTLSK